MMNMEYTLRVIEDDNGVPLSAGPAKSNYFTATVIVLVILFLTAVVIAYIRACMIARRRIIVLNTQLTEKQKERSRKPCWNLIRMKEDIQYLEGEAASNLTADIV